jgi:hypothetical protein
LLKQEIADRFFAAVVRQAHLRRYISGEHFSVDGTLLEAWASHKSFRPKDDEGKGGPPTLGRNPEVDYHGERRSKETHQSTTDPEARLARKGHSVAAKLSYAGHLLMENRSALIADMDLSLATGYAERETALTLLRRLPKSARRRTVAGDKGYDTRDFVAGCREIGVTPHVAQNTTHRRSAIDGRTTRHAGHVTSLRIRKRIEEPFGWMKTVAGGRKLRYPQTGPLAHRATPQPFRAPPEAKINTLLRRLVAARRARHSMSLFRLPPDASLSRTPTVSAAAGQAPPFAAPATFPDALQIRESSSPLIASGSWAR